jgi:hypothetical protein
MTKTEKSNKGKHPEGMKVLSPKKLQFQRIKGLLIKRSE